MTNRKKFEFTTADEVLKMTQLYSENLTPYAIGKQLKRSPALVKYHLAKKPEYKAVRRILLTSEEKDAIEIFYKQGDSINSISRRLKISYDKVSRYIKSRDDLTRPEKPLRTPETEKALDKALAAITDEDLGERSSWNFHEK